METTGRDHSQELATLFDLREPMSREPAAPTTVEASARTRIILGVDPGTSGAIAFFNPDCPAAIEVHDVPVVDGQLDCGALARIVRASGATEAVVERVSAMPKQGVSSTFKFGMAYGAVLAAVALLNLPLRQETPARWKKHFRLSSDKEEARGLAIRTWPASAGFGRKKDHGRAEAALLALFASEVVR